MRAKPELRFCPGDPAWKLEQLTTPDLIRYRDSFHRIGDEYLWTLRLLMTDLELTAYLTDPQIHVYWLVTPDGDLGLLELDFRVEKECEVALFGVAAQLQGTGAGRWLMNQALEIAWARPIERFWLHTCTLDHPNALAFYRRTGLTPYARKVEVFDDPRYLGVTRTDAAPKVPIL